MINSYNYIIKITITILFGATEFVQTNFVICPYIMTEMIWQPMILEENSRYVGITAGNHSVLGSGDSRQKMILYTKSFRSTSNPEVDRRGIRFSGPYH